MILSYVKKAIENVLGKETRVFGLHHFGGGSINQTYKVITDKGAFFIKAHETAEIPRMFKMERNGLVVLAQSCSLDVAKPIGCCEIENYSFLIIEWIEQAPESPDFWSNLGEGIAELHLQTTKFFGLSEDNYFGSLLQSNNRLPNWGEFFVKNRLRPMVKQATENCFFDDKTIALFEKYYEIVERAYPVEKPSLLHGDLWRGNIMTNSHGLPCLIDPAIFYGHRELDIAMTQFVNVFPPAFYEAYQAIYPLQPDWDIRKDFAFMYYNLAHLNSFGISYLPVVESNLYKWVGK